VLRAEAADVLTIYDWHGNYGHPDHIKVNRVGVRAAEMVADELPRLRVFEATVNRDAMVAMIAQAAEAGVTAFGVEEEAFDPNGPMDDGNPIGMPEADLTHEVDVSGHVAAKRAAISSHRSQVTDTGLFLSMSEEMFAAGFGREWFIERGREPGMRPGWLFEE
jgi:LmbE family N-acetylglucosaminyl deacetylase